MTNKHPFIFHPLKYQLGGGEETKLEIVIDTTTGESQAVIRYSIAERFPITELEKAEDLFARLTCGDGRKVYTLEELAHPYNPNPHD